MRTRSILAICLGVPVLVVAAVAAYLGTYDARQTIVLEDVLSDSAWDRAMMPNAREATAEICNRALPCVQAVEADTLTLLRFRTEDDARAAAERYDGDAHLSGWIVVRYEEPGLTAAQREEFEDSLDCINVGIGPEGQEC